MEPISRPAPPRDHRRPPPGDRAPARPRRLRRRPGPVRAGARRGAAGRGRGRRRLQGGAGRVRLRQDLLRPLAPGARQADGLRHRRGADLRGRDAAAPAGDGLPPRDGAALHRRRFQGAFRPVVDGWFYGLEEEVLAEGRVDPARRGGAGGGDRGAAGAAAVGDQPGHAPVRRWPCGATAGPAPRATPPRPTG